MEAADTLQPQGHPRLCRGSAWEDRRAGEARPTKRQARPQDQMGAANAASWSSPCLPSTLEVLRGVPKALYLPQNARN